MRRCLRSGLLALVLPAGCSWYSASVELRVRLPQPPEHWLSAFPQLCFELASPQAELPPAPIAADGSASLRLPKRANWPVLAYPRARGVLLPPAGALYPLDLDRDGESLRLSWEHGPAAQVLQKLACQGVDVSRLNGERLLERMLALSAGDPGGLDLDHLASRLASGEFRVTDLRLRPTRELRLEVPPGTWFLDSPFRLPQEVGPGQELLLLAVPWGRHHLFAVQLPGGFRLYVSEREALRVPIGAD